jgi:hypothetical protein
MFIPPLADRSKAEALFKENRDFRFIEVICDYFPYTICAWVLGIVITIQIGNYLPFDLPQIAVYFPMFIVVIGFPFCSFFILRKMRSRHNRELKAIYAELFFEGFVEKQVVRLVSSTFMYLLLPTRPSDYSKRETIKYKDELWKLDSPLED